MAGHPDDDYNRDILDIIPERFDADPDSYPARSGLRLRNWLILGGAVLAVGVAVAVGWRMFAGSGAHGAHHVNGVEPGTLVESGHRRGATFRGRYSSPGKTTAVHRLCEDRIG